MSDGCLPCLMDRPMATDFLCHNTAECPVCCMPEINKQTNTQIIIKKQRNKQTNDS